MINATRRDSARPLRPSEATSPSPALAPQVKGLAFRTTMSQVVRLCGADVAERATSALPAELRDALGGGHLLVSGWYPIDWYKAMFRAICNASQGGPGLVRAIGHDALVADTSTLHRPLLRLLSPATLTSLGARYFGRFYNRGSYSVVSSEEQKIALQFVDCAGFDRNMWLEVLGSMEAFVELSGRRDVRAYTRGGAGDEDDWANVVACWH